VGLIAPGETAIVLGGVVAAQGEINLVTVLLIAWVAAALGDVASFALGARLGRRFIHAHGPRLGMTAPRVDRVEAALTHGAFGLALLAAVALAVRAHRKPVHSN
jgi:membrane-associated protein